MKGLFAPGTRLSIREYFMDPRVLTEATRVAQSAQAGNRSRNEVHQDCANGYALQYAVFDELLKRGVNVSESTKKEYDLIVTSPEQVQSFYDVKGIFKSRSKTYSQTAWECSAVPRLGHKVFYLCFNCKDGTAKYEGWTDQSGFQPSIFYSGSFIYAAALNK